MKSQATQAGGIFFRPKDIRSGRNPAIIWGPEVAKSRVSLPAEGRLGIIKFEGRQIIYN